mmetsp:Transcript_21776/g.35198  ORF Transcript_21776/g.35198 Transcript_21776/m.35198 type:complete len:655 (-) Transcript_21776:199-2163(-)|eukprot:jgi/Bigna1/132986/aug1.19_g7694
MSGPACAAIARLRPPEKKAQPGFIGDEQTNTVRNAAGLETSFSKVYLPTTNLLAMFTESLRAKVFRVMEGRNVCLCAYGTPNSGNKEMMFGSDDGTGVISMAIQTLFAMMESGDKNFCVTVSMCQVASDMVVDLLNPTDEASLQIKTNRSGFYIEGQSYQIGRNEGETVEIINQGLRVHKALTTQMQTVAKPQILIDVVVESCSKGSHLDQIVSGKLRLALIESGKEALTLDNGLRNLVAVIQSLAAGVASSQVPYNSSPLTQLLALNLGGNCETTFIATIDPIGETESIEKMLALMTKIPKIINTAVVNKSMLSSEIQILRKEIRAARAKMKLSQPGRFLHDIDQKDLAEFQNKLKNLEILKETTWEAKRQKSVEWREKRKTSLRKLGLLHVLQEKIAINTKAEQQAKDLKKGIVESLTMLNRYSSHIKKEEMRQTQWASDEKFDPRKIEASKEKVRKYQKQRKEEMLNYEKQSQKYRKLIESAVEEEERKRKTYMMSAEQLSAYHSDVEHNLLHISFDNNNELVDSLIDLERKKCADLVEFKEADDKVRGHIEARYEAEKKAIRRGLEREHLKELLVENKFRYEAFMHRNEVHMLDIFKQYREHFEEQKREMEHRYRNILKQSVQDAVLLQKKNLELQAQVNFLQKNSQGFR